jgi:hypothetical protein
MSFDTNDERLFRPVSDSQSTRRVFLFTLPLLANAFITASMGRARCM